MLLKIILTLLLSVSSAILYRLGGKGKPYNTKFRDMGCPLCGTLILLVWWKPHGLDWLMLVLSFGFTFAAMTTYWDKLFGYDNFYFHGFMVGLASFPLIWVGFNWYSILISSVISGVLMGLWSKFNGNDVKEETGRGFIYAVTRLLLFI